MITGWIVRIVYIIGVLVIVLMAIAALAGGILSGILSEDMDMIGLITGPIGFFVILIFGNILWRLTCESVILIFSLHDNLVAIRKALASGATPTPNQQM